jgi:hypothetical protein
MNPDSLYETTGAIHIHTKFSDGSGRYEEIIQAASEVGLKFLLFADHWTLEPKKRGYEGYHNGLLVGIGCELNDRKLHNHLLAFEIDREIEPGLEAVEYTRRVVESGGWAVVAHPDERRNHLPEFPAYPWTAWESEDFQAMEIWNHLSEWMERLTRRNKYWLYINPRRSVITPTRWTLTKWDELNRRRRVVGIGGVDAHAHHYPLWGNITATIFPYKVAFRSIQVHVLLDEPLDKANQKNALAKLFSTLRRGRLYIANRYVGDAAGFRFWAVDSATGAAHQMGERMPKGTSLRFSATLPPDATQGFLLKDSKLIHRWRGDLNGFDSRGSGVYRIEARRRGRAFIFSNPIVIEP